MKPRYFLPIIIFFVLFPAFQASAENFLAPTFKEPLKDKNKFALNLLIGEEDEAVSNADFQSWLSETISLSIDSAHRSEMENPDYCEYQKSLLCRLVLSYKMEDRVSKSYRREVNKDKISAYLDDLAAKYDRAPENAKFKLENGKITTFSLSKSGVVLEKEMSLKAIEENLKLASPKNEILLPIKKVDAEITTDSIDNLGITSLIGEGRSNFRGSPTNRIYNIKVALKKFDGLLIKPGEEFSFVKNLGEVNESTGYRPELVIKKDKTELDYGGGICQVSTTVFRAAINSGVPITMRRNHAYPVSYYNPPGMDATVYVPLPDLRFKNDTPGHILLETKIVGTELIINFYGTNDGRKVEVVGPTITERNPDGSMKTTFTQKVMDANGQTIREDVFKSAYDSPNNYPHPDSTILTKKPSNWSDREWREYKKAHDQ